MFEDSTFESTGRIRTRSRGWMFATFALNASILLALILIPLIYPEALPRQALAFLLTVPPPPAAPPPLVQQPTLTFHGAPQMDNATLVAPRVIPIAIAHFSGPEADPGAPISMDSGSGIANGVRDAFGSRALPPVHPDVKNPVRVSSLVVAGLLIRKVTPLYPPIAIATHQQGTVILQATISKSGTIENLRVASGPVMLQQAALDAVQHWLYRPYQLNGQPVEVETTINVVFNLDR
ncbi:MAG TPA: energy transducer TonB [Terracidiphilus sp.]|nr:energy transducer TonB [Terracidiphilus sp.]